MQNNSLQRRRSDITGRDWTAPLPAPKPEHDKAPVWRTALSFKHAPGAQEKFDEAQKNRLELKKWERRAVAADFSSTFLPGAAYCFPKKVFTPLGLAVGALPIALAYVAHTQAGHYRAQFNQALTEGQALNREEMQRVSDVGRRFSV